MSVIKTVSRHSWLVPAIVTLTMAHLIGSAAADIQPLSDADLKNLRGGSTFAGKCVLVSESACGNPIPASTCNFSGNGVKVIRIQQNTPNTTCGTVAGQIVAGNCSEAYGPCTIWLEGPCLADEDSEEFTLKHSGGRVDATGPDCTITP